MSHPTLPPWQWTVRWTVSYLSNESAVGGFITVPREQARQQAVGVHPAALLHVPLRGQQKRFDGLFIVWFWLAEIKKKKRKTQNKIQTESQRTQNRQKLDDAWFFVSKLTTKLQYRNHTVLPWKLASQTNGIVQKCIMWSKGYWQEWKFSTWKKTVCKKQYPEARDMHETMTWLLT